MAIFHTQNEATKFEARVHHDYQYFGFRLRKTIRNRVAADGNRHVSFPKMTEGKGHKIYNPFQDYEMMNAESTNVEVEIGDFYAAQASSLTQTNKIRFNDVKEMATVLGGAMGRLEDQEVLTALENDHSSEILDETSSTSVDDKLLSKINEYMDDNSIKAVSNEIFCLISPSIKRMLIDSNNISSYDFYDMKLRQNPGKIENGKISDINFIVIPNMEEGGLPKNNGVRTLYAYAHDALGYAYVGGENIMVTHEKIPGKPAIMHRVDKSFGVKTIDNKGVLKILVNEG